MAVITTAVGAAIGTALATLPRLRLAFSLGFGLTFGLSFGMGRVRPVMFFMILLIMVELTVLPFRASA